MTAALVALSLLGALMLVAIWIAAMRFEARYPVEYRPSIDNAGELLDTAFSVAGRGVTLRDLVALGLVTPAGSRAAARKKKSTSDQPPPGE